MAKSMTGFGRFEVSRSDRKVSVEIKSVNHRYLELGVKMPKVLNYMDADIRNKVKEYVKRGKVDVFIIYENNAEGDEAVVINEALASEYVNAYAKLSEKYSIENDIKTSHLMRSPDVIKLENTADNEELMKELVLEAVEGALKQLVESRTIEGEKLKTNIKEKLTSIKKCVDVIEAKSPEIVKEYQDKIYAKVKELLDDTQIEESRIVQEVTIFADKICVDEEIVRLAAHVESMSDTLDKEGSIGRNLDFLAQEMNREANTTLSKTSDKDISEIAITLKTDIEKVREQIQNIE